MTTDSSVWTKLQNLMGDAINAINGASDENALTLLQKKYLGKKGEVQACMQFMKELPGDLTERFVSADDLGILYLEKRTATTIEEACYEKENHFDSVGICAHSHRLWNR